ncbi:phosphoribulokinase [Oceanobacillus piezotolerans]|uniref:Phosphoribulokinase n=1 Tax=Oceanobacillus piezotolerans TaxID=2448030 RepID=A0A498DMS9_9BACI|nr:phosphoribulokinase [Oceanobacillus piezotolerans]RLL48360.1 phosphoribulokinase [Oceanobacillus piezotolerans]
MDTLIQEIVRWIYKSNMKLIIGVSGHGAAGKTTFAHMLMEELKCGINYLNTDPYILSSTVRKSTFIDYTHKGELHHYKMTACHPAAHHLPSLERDILMLREGMNLRTIDAHYLESEILSSQNKLTIVEGMSVAFISPELFDLLIYFYTDGATELVRRVGRDIEERGANFDYLKQSHHERRIQYEVFMHPYSKNFDVVIKSTQEKIYIEENTFDFSKVL